MRPLRQPEFQNGIDDLAAGRNGRIHGEASIDDRVNAKRGIGTTRGEIREEPILYSLYGGIRGSEKKNRLPRAPLSMSVLAPSSPLMDQNRHGAESVPTH